jgi:hypothetical protein
LQLEAELQNCQLFLNSRVEERLPSQLDPINIQNENKYFMEVPAAVENDQRAKPKTFTDLLNFLENAPDGPVELDPSLLYSPRSSIQDGEGSVAGKYLEGGAMSNDNLLFPRSTAPPPKHHHHNPPQAADENRALNERISLSKLRALHRLEELRIEQQRAEMAECSFAPNTGRPPTGPQAARLQLKVEDRLLLAANQRKTDVTRRLQQEKEENERAACTFAPQLIAPSKRHLQEKPHIPIHERLNDEWRRKEAIIEHARVKADAEASFKPTINPVSVQLAKQRRLRKKVQKEKGEEADVPCAQVAVMENSQTKINPVSQRMLEISSRVPIEFHRRQQHFIKKREENMHSLASEAIGEAKECSFKPDIGDTATSVLALSNKRFDQAIEGPEERWNRMAFKESQLKEERLRIKEAEIRAKEATFQPQLNPRSLNIAEEKKYLSSFKQQQILYGRGGNNQPAGDRMDFLNEKEAEQRRRRESIATRDLKECTFFPNTAKPRVIGYYDEYEPPMPHADLSIAAAMKDHPCGGGPDALLQRIDEHRRKKEQWAARVRSQEEKKELAECTFVPSINKTRSPAATAAGTVNERVAGMGRFLEVKAMAERRQAELDARAAKVFLLQPRSPKTRGGLTVPKPFKLASDARTRQNVSARQNSSST